MSIILLLTALLLFFMQKIVMGKDTPKDYVHQYEKEEGKTSSLLARLTQFIWHSEKIVDFLYYKLLLI